MIMLRTISAGGAIVMRIHLRFLRRAGLIQERLRNDGWLLEPGKDESLSARHPHVADESAARTRLHALGLLTSGSLLIEFGLIPDERDGRP
jgi:hypothetical protein